MVKRDDFVYAKLYTTEWTAIQNKGGRKLTGVFAGALSPKEIRKELDNIYTGTEKVSLDTTTVHCKLYRMPNNTFLAYASEFSNI